MTDTDPKPTSSETPDTRPLPEDDTASNTRNASAADPEAEMFGDTDSEEEIPPPTSPTTE